MSRHIVILVLDLDEDEGQVNPCDWPWNEQIPLNESDSLESVTCYRAEDLDIRIRLTDDGIEEVV